MYRGPVKKKRKSPHEHKVRAHTRKGRPVNQYQRGKGDKPTVAQRIRKRVVVGAKKLTEGSMGYVFLVRYLDADREMFPVTASNWRGAMIGGLTKRIRIEMPKEVKVALEG